MLNTRQMQIWKQKPVLVTGGSGFVGGHLIQRLTQQGFRVYTVSRKKSPINKKYNIEKELYGDVSDWAFVTKIFKANKFSICFHLASQTIVETGTVSPLQTLKTNIDGATHILEASRRYLVDRVILASTAHVYGDNANVPYKEYYTPRPSRIYETSKVCADIIAQSYIATYNSPIFIGRFTNIYGPSDLNFSRIIPKTMKSIIDGKEPAIWGGKAVRDFLYIDDAIDAYLKLLEVDMKKTENHIFNFGSNNIITIKDLVSKIIDISGVDTKLKIEQTNRRDEIKSQYVSWNKAKRVLDWSPKISLESGLREAYNWYSQYLKELQE